MTGINKKLLFILPIDAELYKAMEQNLKYLNFSEYKLIAPKFKHTFKTRMINLVLKHMLGRKAYKRKIVTAYYSKHIVETLQRLPDNAFDYAVVIRPDKLNNLAIDEVLRVSQKSAGYQWDGLARFPNVLDVISRFDRFFIFDPDDMPAYKEQFANLHLCTNFFFDFPEPEVKVSPNEVMYAGSYQKERMDILSNIVNELSKHAELTFNIKVVLYHYAQPLSHPSITFNRKGVGYLTYLKDSRKAGILLDVKACMHGGLSLRIFEAMKYDKKLITDNVNVKRYDFYRPENIFVVENGCFDGLDEFLKTPYVPLEDELKQKYSFTNWLRYVLDMPPYQPTEVVE